MGVVDLWGCQRDGYCIREGSHQPHGTNIPNWQGAPGHALLSANGLLYRWRPLPTVGTYRSAERLRGVGRGPLDGRPPCIEAHRILSDFG